MLNWIRKLLMTLVVAILAGLFGCNGGSSDQGTTASFKGINQTYTLAGGRRLRLSGLTGTYSTTTISGIKTTSVSLTRDTMVIGGQSISYLADQNFIQGGGFMGY